MENLDQILLDAYGEFNSPVRFTEIRSVFGVLGWSSPALPPVDRDETPIVAERAFDPFGLADGNE